MTVDRVDDDLDRLFRALAEPEPLDPAAVLVGAHRLSQRRTLLRGGLGMSALAAAAGAGWRVLGEAGPEPAGLPAAPTTPAATPSLLAGQPIGPEPVSLGGGFTAMVEQGWWCINREMSDASRWPRVAQGDFTSVGLAEWVERSSLLFTEPSPFWFSVLLPTAPAQAWLEWGRGSVAQLMASPLVGHRGMVLLHGTFEGEGFRDPSFQLRDAKLHLLVGKERQVIALPNVDAAVDLPDDWRTAKNATAYRVMSPWVLRTTRTGWSLRSDENGTLFGSGSWQDMSMADDDPYFAISPHGDALQTQYFAVLPKSADDALVTDLTTGQGCGATATTFGPYGWTLFSWTAPPPDSRGGIHRFGIGFTDPGTKRRRQVVFG